MKASVTKRALQVAIDKNIKQASVALILKDSSTVPGTLDVLFIRRAAHKGDPWSGHIAFPGGKVEEGDRDLMHTSQRETLEETGLILGECIGQLEDWNEAVHGVSKVVGSRGPINVSCFIYKLGGSPALTLNNEAADAVWFPVQDLLDPSRHRFAPVVFMNRKVRVPAIDVYEQVDGVVRPVLWGITYRFVMDFIRSTLPSYHKTILPRPSNI